MILALILLACTAEPSCYDAWLEERISSDDVSPAAHMSDAELGQAAAVACREADPTRIESCDLFIDELVTRDFMDGVCGDE